MNNAIPKKPLCTLPVTVQPSQTITAAMIVCEARGQRNEKILTTCLTVSRYPDTVVRERRCPDMLRIFSSVSREILKNVAQEFFRNGIKISFGI